VNKHALSLLLIFTTAGAMQQQAITLTPDKIATFKAAQKIYLLAKETAQELNKICELTIPDALQPDPTIGQTQQGLRMIVRDYPRFVESPWGLLTLFTSAAHHNPNCFNASTQTLLKKIGYPDTSCLEKLSAWPYEKNNDAYLKDTPITRRNLALPCGSQLLTQIQRKKEYLVENPGSLYNINTVNNEQCPMVIALSCELYRSTENALAEWQALEELAKNNYLQTTPQSTKSPKASKTSPKSFITLPLLTMLPTTAPSDPTSPKSPVPQKTLPEQNKRNSATPIYPVLTRPCSPHDKESSTLRTTTTLPKKLPPVTVKKSEPTCSSMYRF
jgi:hypothetical protein